MVFEKRGGLQVCTWAAQQAMGLPVGVNGFTCGWESFCDTVHMEIGLLPPVEYRSPSQLSQYGHAYPVNDARYNEMQYDEDDGCCACVQCLHSLNQNCTSRLGQSVGSTGIATAA